MHVLTANLLLAFRFGLLAIRFGEGFIIPEVFMTIALVVLFYLSLE